MPKKILALVSEPVSGDALRSAIGDGADDAIERAEGVQEETVERMVEAGIDAAGDTGEADPLLAIQDALQTFEADEIVLFTHGGGSRNWLEEGMVDQAKERFEAPVRHMVIEKD